MLKAMIKLLDDPVQSHNAANWSFSTTMRISGSLYISFDTVKSDFLSAKARLPESPVLTNTFTKLPRLAGIFSATFFLRLASIWGLCFVSFRLIYSVNGGLTRTRREIFLYMMVFTSHSAQMQQQNWQHGLRRVHGQERLYFHHRQHSKRCLWEHREKQDSQSGERLRLNSWSTWREICNESSISESNGRPNVHELLLLFTLWRDSAHRCQ